MYVHDYKYTIIYIYINMYVIMYIHMDICVYPWLYVLCTMCTVTSTMLLELSLLHWVQFASLEIPIWRLAFWSAVDRNSRVLRLPGALQRLQGAVFWGSSCFRVGVDIQTPIGGAFECSGCVEFLGIGPLGGPKNVNLGCHKTIIFGVPVSGVLLLLVWNLPRCHHLSALWRLWQLGARVWDGRRT